MAELIPLIVSLATLAITGTVAFTLDRRLKVAQADSTETATEISEMETAHSWYLRWQEAESRNRDLTERLDKARVEMEHRLSDTLVQHRADIAARDAEWEQKCAQLSAEVAELHREIVLLRRRLDR